jgi:hypothetical protein
MSKMKGLGNPAIWHGLCLFPFIIFLQDLPAEVGKKLPDLGKIVKLWSRHFARLHRLFLSGERH